ncbi:hypothetical protein ACFSQ7_34765 [Paenibacillus rhizoplanae]
MSQYGTVVDDHAVLITEYDSARRLIVIRENQLNKEVTLNVMKGEPFFQAAADRGDDSGYLE